MNRHATYGRRLENIHKIQYHVDIYGLFQEASKSHFLTPPTSVGTLGPVAERPKHPLVKGWNPNFAGEGL